jgi:hypothetical protein
MHHSSRTTPYPFTWEIPSGLESVALLLALVVRELRRMSEMRPASGAIATTGAGRTTEASEHPTPGLLT